MVAAAENRNVITLHKGKICKDTGMNDTQSENMNFGLQINQYRAIDQ